MRMKYRWKIFRADIAFWLIRMAGKADRRALSLFAWNYTESTYEQFQKWSWEKVRNG